MKIARVAIPRPNVRETWDYLVPGDLAEGLQPGMRVLAPVGNASATGYITELTDQAQTSRSLKPIRRVLDDKPLVIPEILELTRWAAGYYLVAWGDMIKAALPAGINVDEETRLRVTAAGRGHLEVLLQQGLMTERDGAIFRLLDLLRKEGPHRARDLADDADGALFSSALGNGWIERHTTSGSAHLEKHQLAVEAAEDPPEMDEAFWNRSLKRSAAWKALLAAGEPVLLAESEERLGASRSVVEGLIKAGLARSFEMTLRRNPFERIDVARADPYPLTKDQLTVYEPLSDAVDAGGFATYLLHGVTGSGKTEIYLHLIKQCLTVGKTALVLIPELSLTPQFMRRYYAVYGERLAVLHSALSAGERTDEWLRVLRGEADVVLGTRLSVFAPLRRLGLVVVDEEHDQSYKQDDYPAFSARDVAVVRASQSGAICLLGSATPSLESLHNVKQGKYTQLDLRKRVFDRPLPALNLIDLRLPENKPDESLLPPVVFDAVRRTLERGGQTMVMVGRKGYAPYVLCRACGETFECKTCSISMAWHEAIHKLKCHYCGRTDELPRICPNCGSTSIETLGAGSAKVEERLSAAFPDARIARMDRDVITNPAHYGRVLDRLRRGEIDIIVGTQMLAKGHDYPDVTTVVAMGLDGILNLPDFRHAERLFQLIIQISGRAGRAERPGEVYILSHRPNHYAVSAAVAMNWKEFLDKELAYRKSLRYPPYGYLAMIVIEDFNRARGHAAATEIAEKLHAALGGKSYILGPALAPYAKLKNRWRHQLFIKAADRTALNAALWDIRSRTSGQSRIKITVDPVDVM